MSKAVEADTLLRGALYSLQESGRLLNDAATLFDAGGHVSGGALAAFAAELLGQHEILIDHWRTVVSGGTVTVAEVKASTIDHPGKQTAGQSVVAMYTDRDKQLGRLLAARHDAMGTEAYASLDAQVKKIDAQIMKARPGNRHQLRLRAMYVDLDDSGRTWLRSSSVSRGECAKIICEVVSDYTAQRDRMLNPTVIAEADLERAVTEFEDKPEFPPPPLHCSAFSVRAELPEKA